MEAVCHLRTGTRDAHEARCTALTEDLEEQIAESRRERVLHRAEAATFADGPVGIRERWITPDSMARDLAAHFGVAGRGRPAGTLTQVRPV
jgi:hypothetical protein